MVKFHIRDHLASLHPNILKSFFCLTFRHQQGFAANFMCKTVVPKILQGAKIKHRHSNATSTRVAYNTLGHLLTIEEVGMLNQPSVFYTNRLVSSSCPYSVHDALEMSMKQTRHTDITIEVVCKCLERHGVTITSSLEKEIIDQLSLNSDRHVSGMGRWVGGKVSITWCSLC